MSYIEVLSPIMSFLSVVFATENGKYSLLFVPFANLFFAIFYTYII